MVSMTMTMVTVDVFYETSPGCLLLPEAHWWPIRHALTECLLLPLTLHVPVTDDLRHHRNPHLHLPLWHHYLLHRLRRLHHLLEPIAHRWPIGHALTECLLLPLPMDAHNLLRLQLRDFNQLFHHLVYHFGHMPHHLLHLDLRHLHNIFHRLNVHPWHMLHYFLHLNLRNLNDPVDSLDVYLRHLNDPLHCVDLVMLLVVMMVMVVLMVVMVMVMVAMMCVAVVCVAGMPTHTTHATHATQATRATNATHRAHPAHAAHAAAVGYTAKAAT